MHPLPPFLSSVLSSLVSLCAIIAIGRAQQQPEEHPRDPSEAPFLQSAAKELDAYATLAFKSYPRRARDVWLELLSEYDTDDAVAREALGFVRVGAAWQPKPGFEYPKTDVPDVGAAKALEGRWKEVCRKLGEGHRELGEQLQQKGLTERANYHLQRSLRYLPADAKAQIGLGAKTVEGVTGTELDLELLRRSRMMERAITELTDQTFEVKPSQLKDERLDKGNKPYVAFETAHFVVFGDWEPEVLTDAAQWMERSLAFCQKAFDGYERWQKPPVLTPRYAFFKHRADWADLVRANASAVGDVEFIVKNTSSCPLGKGKTGLYLSGIDTAHTINDLAVRKVAQEYSLVGTDAVTEGVGHAITGMFFGHNLIVMVAEQKREGTVTNKDYSKFELPDLETWKDLARELAFEKGTAPAAHLPLISAAKFTHEERLKSWSFVDYLLRRNPMLIVELDNTFGKSKTDFDVLAAFQDSTKLSLRGLEDEWKHFYIDDSPALAAIRNKVTPMQAVSKDAPVWLEELNRLRRLYKIKDKNKELMWSAELSAGCRQHADYLKQNKGERGLEQERTQVPGKPGFTNEGRQFAATAVVTTRDKDPRKAMEPWLLLPGYRDVLLDLSLEQIGAYADGPICVLDVIRGRSKQSFTETVIYPYNDTQDASGKKHWKKDPVQSAIDVDLIGPELRALLQKNGQGKLKQVGFPLTAHFFGTDVTDISLSVMAGDDEVKGVLFHSIEGSRRIAAPGLWVFIPFLPLKKGVDINATWTIKERTEKVTFTAT